MSTVHINNMYFYNASYSIETKENINIDNHSILIEYYNCYTISLSFDSPMLVLPKKVAIKIDDLVFMISRDSQVKIYADNAYDIVQKKQLKIINHQIAFNDFENILSRDDQDNILYYQSSFTCTVLSYKYKNGKSELLVVNDHFIFTV